MTTYRIEESKPDWYKGLGNIFTIHDEAGPIRGLRYDVKETAESVCHAMNDGKQLKAELRYKLNGKSHEETVVTTFGSAQEVLFSHVLPKLPGITSVNGDFQSYKAQALKEGGYSEPVVLWVPVD